MSYDYDVIVIGSGAGGGTLAPVLARAGKKVLLVERGPKFTDRTAFQDEWRMLLRMEPYEGREVEVNGTAERLFTGGIVGGGSSLYGAVLMRPAPEDFEPGHAYGDRIPREIREWPVGYDELKPYYDEAERIYHVAGNDPAEMPNVGVPEEGYPYSPPTLEPISRKLVRGMRREGLTPFHLPLGIDFRRCLRCPTCPGYFCPNDSRASSWNRLIAPAMETHDLELLTDTEAEEIVHDANGSLQSVRLLNRRTGERVVRTAGTYVVSAGAVGSAALLLRSRIKDPSGQLGRNYMYHAGALAAGLFQHPTGGADRFIKQLGFTDLYHGTPEFPHKLGYAQVLPVPGRRSLQANAPLPVPTPIAERLYEHIVTLAGAVEDLPLPNNRVTVSNEGRIQLQHRFHAYDVYRSQYFLKRLQRVLRRAGATATFGATGDKDQVHTAHQVGTARFGRDEKTSVLDPDCRVHSYDNLYVVDGSFMPTSLGVGPALTIIANALRTADKIKGRG
ncbi:FAD-binding protein [bacterium]|nr:FAD-binding protein [bacterium]